MVIELPRKYCTRSMRLSFRKRMLVLLEAILIDLRISTQPSGYLTTELSLTNSEIFRQKSQ